MTAASRVLANVLVPDLSSYVAGGGGKGLEDARACSPDVIVAEVDASGLRGRGGAGFPTGRKWQTVRANAAVAASTSVIVNAAEGEPGTFKDRAIIRANPYHVIEGALIAAVAVGADLVVIATKRSFTEEAARLRAAVAEIEAAGWNTGIRLEVFEGPDEYLYGEETALLEVLDGRHPFPRIAPPYRSGVDEVVLTSSDVTSGSGLASHVEMAGPNHTDAAPTLVDNVETLANIPAIVARGADWFREIGTEQSPGSVVCTVTGPGVAGVGEFALGTPLREVIQQLGGPPPERIAAILPGVSNGILGPEHLDTPVTYEDLAAVGSGLGSAGFIVFDDTTHPAAIAAGASRFLAVESCGQCIPCKQDGIAIADILTRLCDATADAEDFDDLIDRVGTVAEGARCSLGRQHETVIGSILRRYDGDLRRRLAPDAEQLEPVLLAELLDVRGGEPRWDDGHAEKQPDWTYNATDSGESPADHFAEHRVE